MAPLRLSLSVRRHTHSQLRRHGSADAAIGSIQVATPVMTPKKVRKRMSLRRLSQVAASPVTSVEIYYGSMTGTAERSARALEGEVAARGVSVKLQDLADFEPAALLAPNDTPTHLRVLVFVVSTHLGGMPSPSAERFHGWLQALCTNGEPDQEQLRAVTHRSKGEQAASPSASPLRQLFSRLASTSHNLLYSKPRRLSGLNYAVFGVGDSMYLTFNAMAKFIDAKLHELGATRFCGTGLGDVSHDLQGIFDAWKIEFLRRLPFTPPSAALRSSGHTASIERERDDVEGVSEGGGGTGYRDNFGRPVRIKHRCTLAGETKVSAERAGSFPTPKLHEEIHDKTQSEPPPQLYLRSLSRTGTFSMRPTAFFDSHPLAEIISAIEVASPDAASADALEESASRVGVFRLKLTDPRHTRFEAADMVAIFPHNAPDEVEQVARAFGYQLDDTIELTAAPKSDGATQAFQHPPPFPTPCTIRTALTEFMELRSVTREFLRVASGFVATAAERDKLENLAATESAAVFRKQIQELHKGVLHVVEIVPTLRIPFDVLVNITTPIKPRFYTIASCPCVSPHEIEIAVSLGRLGQPKGLAVAFFDRVLNALTRDVSSPSTESFAVRGYIASSTFRPPASPHAAMIMIANGAGIAAMRALMQKRYAALDESTTTVAPFTPRDVLFLGVASRQTIAFRDDLDQWEQSGLVEVHYAFSSAPEHPKQYVQDILAQHLDDAMERRLFPEASDPAESAAPGSVYVCGKQSMVRSVRDIFAARTSPVSPGKSWLDDVTSRGGYVEEGFG